MMSTLVIQKDGTIVADSRIEGYQLVREELLRFSLLTQGASHLHTYRMSKLTLWQAASSGMTPRTVLDILRRHTRHGIPYEVQQQVVTDMSWWGRVRLVPKDEGHFTLCATEEDLLTISSTCNLPEGLRKSGKSRFIFRREMRALVKQELARRGFPCVDQLGYQAAAELSLKWRETVQLRDYQQEAIRHFLTGENGQSGVIALPCGAGKTVVGIGLLIALGVETLILTPTDTAGQQWYRELVDKTTLSPKHISMYRESGAVLPVTIATYARLTASNQEGMRRHLKALSNHIWGLVIYDEVHMLPAPLFRLAARLQGARRLGLTATLVREDGAETDVFSLIGPKCYDGDWKELERQGYLASVRCVEVRVPFDSNGKEEYSHAGTRQRHKIAAQNALKQRAVIGLIEKHQNDQVLIIGHYLEQLHKVADMLKCPVMTGKTPSEERERLFNAFRRGKLRRLVLSRVANMSVDIPCASVVIQLSGLYGSRQEEAQRLGRLLRPDSGPGVFYSLVTDQTIESDMAVHRSLFLIEQGYQYDIANWSTDPDLATHDTVERMIHP